MNWNTTKYNENNIDLVYLWVNGNDPELQSIKNYWQEKLGVANNEANNEHKYGDNDELRYSLRSVMKNAPWIRKIFIVTNGQVPKWLDISKTDKIEIVTHEQIMPKDALPTFSSPAIEFCIANIEDLSEHFLLANDDCFVDRPVTPDFFFTKNGSPIARLQKTKLSKYKLDNYMYNRNIQYTLDLINKKYKKNYRFIPQHNIDAYSKSLYKECIKAFPEEFNSQIYSKFRAEGIQRIIIYLYMLLNKKAKLRLIKNRQKYYHHEDSQYIAIKDIRMLRWIRRTTPYLLCINDSCRVNNENLKNFTSFLEYLYPEKMPYEKYPNTENIYYEIIKNCEQYNRKFNLLWKIKNKLFYYTITPFIHIAEFFIKIEKHKNCNEYTILNFITIIKK